MLLYIYVCVSVCRHYMADVHITSNKQHMKYYGVMLRVIVLELVIPH